MRASPEGIKQTYTQFFLRSYVVATGLVDTMARRLLKIRESVENHGSVILSLLATIGLLTKFGDLCPKGGTDLTKFLSTVKSTELLGAVSLLHSTVIPLGRFSGITGGMRGGGCS